jgi:predicted aldo/keto reductase-like oxidoreductase
MNYHKVYGLTEYAKNEFKNLGKNDSYGSSPADCIECGACEGRCPQKIKIREQLKQSVKELS